MDRPVMAEQHDDKSIHKTINVFARIEKPGDIEEVTRVLPIKSRLILVCLPHIFPKSPTTML